MKRFHTLWPWLAAVVSGAMLALCFAPARMGGLAWIALAPLVAAVWFAQPAARFEKLRCFALGYVAGAVYFIGSLAWLITVTGGGWIFLGLYLAFYPALWALFLGTVAWPREAHRLESTCVDSNRCEPMVHAPQGAKPNNAIMQSRNNAILTLWSNSWHNLFAAVAAASAWVALEWVRGHFLTGFGWNSLGVALNDNLAMIQIADVTGVAGLSFLLVMVSVIAAVTLKRLVQEIRERRMRAHWDFSLTVVLAALVFAYGVRRIYQSQQTPVESLTMGYIAVQPNFPVMLNRTDEEDQMMRDVLRDLSVAGVKDFPEAIIKRISESSMEKLDGKTFVLAPDLLVWPESVLPRPLFSDPLSKETVEAVLANFDGTLLSGIVHYDADGDFNSSVMLTDGKVDIETAQLYHKMHLVPFGEYVPLRGIFQWIGDILPDGDFDAGREPRILTTKNGIRVAPLICFEDTLAHISRAFAQRGVQVLVNLTNDMWFERSAASQQQRDNAVFRTVETRLPLLRVANTGVTCFIDAHGRQLNILAHDGDTFVRDVLIGTAQIPIHPQQTFFTRYGEIFTVLCGFFALGVVGLSLRRSLTKQSGVFQNQREAS